MNQVTKAQSEALIERLADKTRSFGAYMKMGGIFLCEDNESVKILNNGQIEIAVKSWMPEDVSGHPIMLTDVLGKPETVLCWEEEERKDRIYDLWCLWYECGVTKSLQDILSEATWGQEWCQCCFDPDPCECHPKDTMKGPAVDLFAYLITL